MKKNLTELDMILDRSGSMGGLESDTIGGYNSMLITLNLTLTLTLALAQA